MFNSGQRVLLIAGFSVILVFFLGRIGGIDGGAAILWGLVVGFVFYLLLRQNLVVSGDAHELNSMMDTRHIATKAREFATTVQNTAVAKPAEPVRAAPPPEPESVPETKADQPKTLAAPRGGEPDDLKRISGIGPKLESALNDMGYYHFDQIAAWGPEEVAWMDENMPGASGRVTRDEWVAQAKALQNE